MPPVLGQVKANRCSVQSPSDQRQDQMPDSRWEVHWTENAGGQSPYRSRSPRTRTGDTQTPQGMQCGLGKGGCTRRTWQGSGNDHRTEDTRAEAEGLIRSSWSSCRTRCSSPSRQGKGPDQKRSKASQVREEADRSKAGERPDPSQPNLNEQPEEAHSHPN